jgi:4-amino-4-deoxy-L-arabinose transferase-like glycosyltransferase
VNKIEPEPFIRPERRWWLLVALISLMAVLAAATRWILYHTYAINWDEAFYFNQALNNIRILHSGNLRHIGGMILIGSPSRPPAYRLLVLPFLLLFGHSIAVARFMTLGLTSLSAWFIYACTRRISGAVAPIMAVLVFCLSSEVVLDSTYFSTEGPLFLGTAAMLYFLIAGWAGEAEHKASWIGLGLAVGLGLLAKMTFFLVAFPVLAFSAVEVYRRHSGVRSMTPLLKAGILASLVAGPWWLLNFRQAFAYATYARGFVRHSYGSPSPSTWAKWLGTIFIALFGPGVSIFIALVLIVVMWRRKELVWGRGEFCGIKPKVLTACACAGLPLTAMQVSGTNHNLRFLSPAIIPLAIAVGVLSEAIGLTRSLRFLVVSSTLFFAQVGMLVAPVLFPNGQAIDPGVISGTRVRLMTSELPWRVFARYPQWDWKPLREISLACGVETPKISYLGNGRAFNIDQVSYPWFAEGVAAPTVVWLWQYEKEALNWQEVMATVGETDMALTAPGYIGQPTDSGDLDNHYNAEFVNRLSQDPRFSAPIRLKVGRFEPVEVLVFVKKTLACRSPYKTFTEK